MHTKAILSTAYLAPIQYYSKLIKHPESIIEQHENYVKQTYRNRCDVYSPNGIKTLTVPLVKRNSRQPIKDIKISYDHEWQKIHWRTLESSYRSSPYFEYFEDDIYPLYHGKKHTFLYDLNEALQQEMFILLKQKKKYTFTKEYHDTYDDATDFRSLISPRKLFSEDLQFESKVYNQVFETKHGFIPNLSIVDLLFNQGSRALEFI